MTGIMRLWFVSLIALLLLGLAAGLFIPWNVSNLAASNLAPSSRPEQSYAGAVQRIEALYGYDAAELSEVCRVKFLTHGQKTERAVAFVHGFTNCPQQFGELGQRFYDLGYNVLIAPLPHHGLADRLTAEPSDLTAAELAAYANEMVDILQGLGEQTVMTGISAGGATTAWAAQNRSDLDLAVLISPAFGFIEIPTPLTAPVMNLFSTLPDAYTWWDPELQASGGPLHTYPRYSRRGLAQILRLGYSVQVAARQSPPAAQAVLVVTNANDAAVDNLVTAGVVANWLRNGADLSAYEFPADLLLDHDLIDPTHPDQRIDIVYPRLIELIAR